MLHLLQFKKKKVYDLVTKMIISNINVGVEEVSDNH